VLKDGEYKLPLTRSIVFVHVAGAPGLHLWAMAVQGAVLEVYHCISIIATAALSPHKSVEQHHTCKHMQVCVKR
jgi:hypothetical protein